MSKNYFPLIPALLLLIFLAACSKEGPNGATGPAGPAYTGTISGHVSLYDKYGSKVLSGYKSAKIVLNGATVNPDSTGFYSYGSIVTGNYSISASKDGYAATTLNNVQFISSTLNRDIQLSAIPDSFLNSFTSVLASDAATDSLTISVNADNRPRNSIIFLSNKPSVGNGSYLLSYVKSIPATATTIIASIPAQDLYNAGFARGAIVYYAAYSYVVNDASLFEDLATGKNVYNAVNPNPLVDSTVVP